VQKILEGSFDIGYNDCKGNHLIFNIKLFFDSPVKAWINCAFCRIILFKLIMVQDLQSILLKKVILA